MHVGKEYRRELRELTGELPALYEEAEAVLCSEAVGQALAYHAAIWAFLHDANDPSEAPLDSFPVLRRVRAGERRKGRPPTNKKEQQQQEEEGKQRDGPAASHQPVCRRRRRQQ